MTEQVNDAQKSRIKWLVTFYDGKGQLHTDRVFHESLVRVKSRLEQHLASFVSARMKITCLCGTEMDEKQSHCFDCNRRNPYYVTPY